MNLIDKFSPGHPITVETRLEPWIVQIQERWNGEDVSLIDCEIFSSDFTRHAYLIDTPDGPAVCYYETAGQYFGTPYTAEIAVGDHGAYEWLIETMEDEVRLEHPYMQTAF